MSVDVQVVAQVLAQSVVIGGGLAAAYWGIVRWLRRVAGASERAEAQLRTGRERTAGQLVEATSRQLEEIRQQMKLLTRWNEANRDGWQSAIEAAERAESKIDKHLDLREG